MPIINTKWDNTTKPLANIADKVDNQQMQVKIQFTEIGFFFMDLVLIIPMSNGGKRVTEYYPNVNEFQTWVLKLPRPSKMDHRPHRRHLGLAHHT